ncbi:glycosyltransferase family 4 protein [Paenibacillus sp. CMAA1364]
MSHHRLTVLIFSHVANANSITGAEKLLLFFCTQLSAMFDCTLVVPNEGKLTQQARKLGVNVVELPLPLVYEMYTPTWNLVQQVESLKDTQAYGSLKQFILSQSPDMILTNTCVHILPAMAAKELRIPIVWKVTEMIAANEFTPIAVSLIDRYSDWIISISEAVTSCFPQEVIQSKLTVLYPSLDEKKLHKNVFLELREQKRKALHLNKNHKLVGYISSYLSQEKGLHYFIEMALEVLNIEPMARFLIIGTPMDEAYLYECQSIIRDSQKEKNFAFIAYEESVQAAYCAMDIVVVPSIVKEGFGLTALEGMLYAKPVVAFSSGGLCEILEIAQMREYLVEPGNTEQLSSKVCQLLAMDDLGVNLGGKSRELVQSFFGEDQYNARLQQMIAIWMHQYPGWFLPHHQPEETEITVHHALEQKKPTRKKRTKRNQRKKLRLHRKVRRKKQIRVRKKFKLKKVKVRRKRKIGARRKTKKK